MENYEKSHITFFYKKILRSFSTNNKTTCVIVSDTPILSKQTPDLNLDYS